MLNVLLFIVFFIGAFNISQAFADKDNVGKLCDTYKKSTDFNNSADYVAGIDVHGNAVVPADINEQIPNPIYNPITIPIEIDLAQRYGLNLPLGVELKPTVADIKIFEDGRIQYNDVDITQNIQSVCKNYHDHHKKIQSNQTEQHGHESSDPVLSSDKIEGQYPEDTIKRPHYND